MRAFLDVLTFELRLQCRAPLFLGALLLFFLIHLLTMAQAGIHLSDNELIHFNSPYLILQTELVLGLFGMLPAVIFIVNAIVRDHQRATVELFFTTPVGKLSWLLGRFSGGTICALLAGLAGLLGTLAGSFMPWLDQTRIAPFDVVPYAVSVAAIDLPNLLVFCAISFSVAALSRSQAWAFAVALCLVVAELLLYNANANGAPAWLALLDPLGALPIGAASRYLTVAELNTQLPVTMLLLGNRVLWLGVGLASLAFAVSRFRLELSHRERRPFSGRRKQTVRSSAAPPSRTHRSTGSFAPRDTVAQFASQLRTDLRGVVLSPLFALIVVFTAVSTISEFRANTDMLMGLPLHPLTGLMLGFFRFGLFQFVLIVLIFHSATLVFREREHGLAEIVGATPHPDWVMPLSKTLTLCLAISLLLVASMATCIALQLLAGHARLEPGVYLQGLFIYNGSYFYMLCVLAVAVQVFSPGKWSGMLLLFGILAALLSMEPLGLEHLLYGFRIPFVVYSDMNGFGHFRVQTASLIVYWGLFCLLLLVLGHLLFPRGTAIGIRERLRDARTRMTRGLALGCVLVFGLFAASGGWIYWNTNVLNAYQTSDSRLRAQGAYERKYGAWKNRPTPAISDITMEVDLYPEERRLESRGRALLTNTKGTPIGEFVVSTDPRLRINALSVERASLTQEDREIGFRLYRVDEPLRPGESMVMEWDATRENRGFVNSGPDNEIVADGTYVDLESIAPLPAYDEERELTDPGERQRVGLPKAARLPALGDPAWLNTLGFGVDSRMNFRVLFSTTADQTAVAPGVLERQWESRGRRYFEYVMDRPIWPRVSLTSARYAIARDTWNGVALEVYHDAKHPWNVGIMLDTASKALEYFSREYAPYPFRSFRILEYPRYRTAARAFPGAVAYSETAGFLTDLSGWASLDYTTIHELAHQWWGGMVYGAKMQGRQMLNETMAQVLHPDGVQAAGRPAVAAPRAGCHAPELPRRQKPRERRRAAADVHGGSGQHLVQQGRAGHVRAAGPDRRRAHASGAAQLPPQVLAATAALPHFTRSGKRAARGCRT